MQSSSFLHKAKALLRRSGNYLLGLFRNRYFWASLGVLVVAGLLVYILIDKVMMPGYTRHGTTVRLPDVHDLNYDEAVQLLRSQSLRAEKLTRGYDPNRPRDVVVDQSPPPNALVKPGRRVYLTVNTGEIPMVSVPRVIDVSLREAENRMQALGLRVTQTLPDSIPSPHSNTVTRQVPAPGTRVQEGTEVTLYYSTGLGDRYVTVPDVTGLGIEEAESMLLRRKLRAVVVGLDEYTALGEPTIVRQSREAGTRVREGFELRLFVTEE